MAPSTALTPSTALSVSYDAAIEMSDPVRSRATSKPAL